MERAPLKSLGNILPNCLTLSGQKKLGIGVSQGGSQVSRQETAVHVVKPTAKHVPQQHYSDNTNGKRSRHTSESDRPGPPGTPIKPSGQSSKPGTPPLTPLANLKVLIAAASTALEKEEQLTELMEPGESGKYKEPKDTAGEDGGGRKMKSLAILCKRFLSIAETEIGVGVDFSLESMSKKLGTNRRRIYDIINVLEALEMIVKQSKNWYTWLGQGNLLITLAKMKAMAEDDVDFRAILNKENDSSLSPSELSPSQPSAYVEIPVCGAAPGGEDLESGSKQDEAFSLAGDENSALVSGGRWDKSLGVLCQKFVMLFLVTPDNEVTLDYAGNVLMPDDPSFSPMPLTNPKTKVRRLYDIANVLTTLGLIRKKTFLAPNHRKMPGYSWAGPSLDQIKTISVFRKSESNLYPFYSKRRGSGGTALTRRPSFGSVRPFLHQYEVKGEASTGNKSTPQPNSAPSSPVKSKESGFKRSLSFGAGPAKKQLPKVASVQSSTTIGLASKQQATTSTQVNPVPVSTSVVTPTVSGGDQSSSAVGKCVVARQLPQQQVDYLQEVVEFETELLKHTHKYPHIAPFFHDFVIRFYNTLRQAAIKTTEPPASQLGNAPIVGIASLNQAGNFSNAVSMATSYAEIMSPRVNATPSSETLLPTTPILNLDHAGFNPNSLLVTSPAAYTFLPTTTASSPSFFPFYTSSLSPMAMMAAAALGRTTAGVAPTSVRSLAPKPSCMALGEQGALVAEDSSNPAKKAKMEDS